MTSEINNFSKQLIIRENRITAGRNPHISFYSLEKKQKTTAITLIVAALIIFSIGAVSLGGNIVRTNAAWAMLGVGLGISTVTAAWMITNHLLFLRQIGRFLATQQQNIDWQDARNYPDDMSHVQPQFSYNHAMKTIYGKRYLELPCGKMTFHIDFHRTLTIHNERI